MSDELYAKIYVGGEREDVISRLVAALDGEVVGHGRTVSFDSVEVDVRRSEDRDDRRFSPTFEGFVFAPTYLDVIPKAGVTRERMIQSVCRILECFWSANMIAVAAADFEDELPNNGGVGLLL